MFYQMEKICPFGSEKVGGGLRRPARHISGAENLQVLSSTKARTSGTDNDNRKSLSGLKVGQSVNSFSVVMNYTREGELKTLNQILCNQLIQISTLGHGMIRA